MSDAGTRSHQAADLLDANNYRGVYDMTDGMLAWVWGTELCYDVPALPRWGAIALLSLMLGVGLVAIRWKSAA